MQTSFLDFLLVGLAIAVVTILAWLLTWLLSFESLYRPLIDLAVFLVAYGLCSMGLLALVRIFVPYPVGRHKMSSSAFTYWKVNAVLVDLAEKALRPFTTVFSQTLVHGGFGATIGGQVALAGVPRDHPLLTIGAGATIGQNSVITAHAITHDEIVLKPAVIGPRAVVGINCVVMPGLELGEGAVLAPGAVATIDTKIAPYELWGGVPARKIKDLDPLG
jgi:acetyltransferase-like isoleucine patch superfamily enzyme